MGGPALPRPILNLSGSTPLAVTRGLPPTGPATTGTVPPEQRLRLRRSPKYLEQLGTLDAGSPSCDPAEVERLLAAIAEELPEISLDQRPLGIVAKCYLGNRYEVHILDVAGSIVRHFRRGEPLPGRLERARSLAQHDAYEVVEVYADCLRAVGPDGQVFVVGG